jgi:hypothetical protein
VVDRYLGVTALDADAEGLIAATDCEQRPTTKPTLLELNSVWHCTFEPDAELINE